jgi:bla regulator protein blaR1
MGSGILHALWESAAALSCGIVLTLLMRRPLRHLFGSSVAYLAWLSVPASLFVLMPSGHSIQLPALSIAISAPSVADLLPSGLISPGIHWRAWCLWIWGSGILMCGMCLVRQQLRFMSSLGALHESIGVLRAECSLNSPLVVGLWRPRIVVPGDFDTRYTPEERTLILAHEQMHLRRGDLPVNAMWAFARCIFWFNPLAHVASWFIRLDQELACDEEVIRDHPEARKLYANALLNTQLAATIPPLGCLWPPTHPLKERIMLLKRSSPRGIQRAAGQIMVGALVLTVGYGAWAVQPNSAAPSSGIVQNDISKPNIDFSADMVDHEGSKIQYRGNVVIKVMDYSGPVETKADSEDVQPDGNVLLEGNVQIRMGNLTITTKRAIMSGDKQIRTFKMDEARVGSI